jgi:hypothetical protein
MNYRSFNKNHLNPAIAANDPDGIADYFVSLVDYLFFGPEKTNAGPVPQISIPPASFEWVLSLPYSEVATKWPGFIPKVMALLDLFDPDLCEARYLPYLARYAGVDTRLFFDELELTEKAKRQLIKDSVTLARFKGTTPSFELLYRALGWQIFVNPLFLDLRNVGGPLAPEGRQALAWRLGEFNPEPQPEEGYWFDPALLVSGSGLDFTQPPDSSSYWRRLNHVEVFFQRPQDSTTNPIENLLSLVTLFNWIKPIHIIASKLGVGQASLDDLRDLVNPFDDLTGELHNRTLEIKTPYPQLHFPALFYDQPTSTFLNYDGIARDQWSQPYYYRGYTEAFYSEPYPTTTPALLYGGSIDYDGASVDPYGDKPPVYIGYPAATFNTDAPRRWLIDDLEIEMIDVEETATWGSFPWGFGWGS